MWEIPAGPSASNIRSGWLSAFLNQTISRTRTVSVPYKLGEVVVGDDPFNGRREDLVCVKNVPALRAPGGDQGDFAAFDVSSKARPGRGAPGATRVQE